MSVNKAVLLGNIGKDPEVRRTNNNTIANLTLATSEKWTDKQGNRQEKTEWHSIVVFNKTAEFVEKFVGKGTQVYVEGKIRNESYEKDGEKKYVTRIYADIIQILSGGKKDGNNNQAPSNQSAPKPVGGPEYFEPEDDDLPFD